MSKWCLGAPRALLGPLSGVLSRSWGAPTAVLRASGALSGPLWDYWRGAVVLGRLWVLFWRLGGSPELLFPGKSGGSGFSLSGETFRSPYQIGVRIGAADCFTCKTQYFWHVMAWSTAIYRRPALCCSGALLFAGTCTRLCASTRI